ncbi:hypothetical protein MMC18_003674 [Xylographa bjoerkii]|nr:hypothetical protein [Xylographa bjoerkii]
MSNSDPSWSRDGKTLQYKGHKISLDTFRSTFVHGLVSNAQRILRKDLLFTDIPDVPLSEISEDFTNTTPGYSFMTDLRNSTLLLNGFTNIPARKPNFGHDATQIYIQSINTFLELLLILILVTGGQPPHGTSLTSLQLSNVEGFARSIIMWKTDVFIATSDGNLENPKPVIRFLPKAVVDMLVLYITDVRPFLRHQQFPNDPLSRSNFLFPENGSFWSSDRYEAILKRVSAMHLGVELDLEDYRIVFLAIAKKAMPGVFDEEGNCLVA